MKMKPARPEDIPVATHTGVMKFGDLEIRVHRLDDGRTIIDADDFKKIMAFLDGGSGELSELLENITPPPLDP
jgi:hypothetical protein